MGAFFLSFVFAWELRLRAIQGKTRGRDETGWWTRGLACEQTMPKSEVFFQGVRPGVRMGGGGLFFPQLAQCNLRRATCADQLAPTSLRRAPCLALSRACFTKCREKERILQRWADLACDVLLSGQPWSNNKRAMISTLWGPSSCPLFLPGS